MSTSGLFVRWVARFLSAIIALILVVIFIGEVAGADSIAPPGLSFTEIVMSVFFFATWLGLLVGWWNERLGGWMIVGGLAAFYLVEFIASGSFPSGLFFLYMLIPGILYLVSERINRESNGETAASVVPQEG